jgi:hypothetical protein
LFAGRRVRAGAQGEPAGIGSSSAGIVIEEPVFVLVEGGYLHSLKLIIEKASATPDGLAPKKGSDSLFAQWRARTPFSVMSPLKRLGLILLGGPYRD